MARECAFCGTNENLTKEHIFPSSVISTYEDSLISITDKSDSYFRSDLVVKDVCASCNNGKLSKLDGEFITLFKTYMAAPIAPGDKARIKFEYMSLLRFLIKVSYNSARASSDGAQAIEALRRYVPFILGEKSSAPEVMLRLQIFTSAKKFNTETNKVEGIIEASMLRNAKIPYDGPQSDSFIVRLIAFNSFWFYLIIPINNASRLKRERFIKGFKNWAIQPGIAISEANCNLVVPVEKTTYIHPSVLNGMYRNSPNKRVKMKR